MESNLFILYLLFNLCAFMQVHIRFMNDCMIPKFLHAESRHVSDATAVDTTKWGRKKSASNLVRLLAV